MTSIAATLDPATVTSDILPEADDIATAPTSAVTPSNTQFVFFAAFDGTNNSLDPSEGGNTQTTAVAQLEQQVAQENSDPSGNVQARYFPGPGTSSAVVGSSAWSAAVTAQAIDSALQAYTTFAQLAFDWLQDPAHAGGSVTSMITGFSRGCAAAAIFSQMLYENGLVFTNTSTGQQTVLIPPGTVGAVSAALMLDPVLTGENVNTDFPPGVQNLTVVQAQNEYRTLFEAANYNDSAATIIQVAGNHSDIGDAYDNGLGGIYLQAYTDFFNNAGLPIGAVPSDRAYVSGASVNIHSESQTAEQILASLQVWDATYNPTNDTSVTRLTNTFGTTPVAVTGSATSFTAYNGVVVLGGTGGSATQGGSTTTGYQNYALLPDSQATVTGNTDAIAVGEDASLTFNSTSLVSGTTNTLQGLPNSIALDDDASVVVNGWDTNIIGSDASVSLEANDNDISIKGTGNDITLGVGASITVSSGTFASDTITLDTSDGGSVTFDAGEAFANATTINNPGTGNITVTVAIPTAYETLGTLTVNTSTDADSFTLFNGLTITPSNITNDTLAAPASGTSPLQTLTDYLGDLGDSLTSAALTALNYAYLNPTGSTHTVTGTTSGSTDTFTLTTSNNAPGVSITGNSTKTNVILLDAATDLSQDSLTDVQQIHMNAQNLTINIDEFTSFSTTDQITGPQGATIFASDGGTYNINSVNTSATASVNLTALGWDGTTLIGNNANGQILTASLLGNDTLTEGNGTGDQLIAGEGVDTLTGGTGGDTFYAQAASGTTTLGTGTFAAGTTITGNGTGNTLEVNGDISGDTISGIQTLKTGDYDSGSTVIVPTLTLTASEFNGFNAIAATSTAPFESPTIIAANGGTYNLGTKDTNSSDIFNMTAASNAGTTLIGNNGEDETLTASATGTDTLTAGNGAEDQLVAGGGTDTLTAGSGAGDILTAGTGVDTLIGGSGADSFVVTGGLAAGSSITANGTTSYTTAASLTAAGDISGATVTGVNDLNPTGDITLTQSQFAEFANIDVSGSTTGITLNAANGGTYNLSTKSTDAAFNLTALSDAGTTLIGDSQNGEILTASASGNDTLTSGSGNDDAIVAGGGNDTLTGGSGTGDTIEAYDGLATGSTITGNGNVLVAARDITGASISGVPTLDLGGDLTLTNAEFTGFTGISSDGSGGSIFAANGGTYNLETKDSASSDTLNMTALSNGGTTLIGNNAANETLTASATGNDTLQAGTGAGDVLVAGGGDDTLKAEGADTLIGGAGVDKFVIANSTALGSTIDDFTVNDTIDLSAVGYSSGGTATLETGNVLQVTEGGSNYDVQLDPTLSYAGNSFVLANDGGGDTDVSIAASTTLNLSGTLELTNAQFNAYTTINGVGTIEGTTAGTYNLSGKTAAAVNLTALTNAGATLIGNNAADETLTASASGNDTLEAGNGAGDVLVAGGGNDTLIGGANADTFVLPSSLAGDSITTSGGTETIVFQDPATVELQMAYGATIDGSDGTMTVATTGNTTINWNTGGSETQVFTTSGGTPVETDTGYSGANGTGTVLYSEVITSPYSFPTATVSGSGAISGINNANVTLENGAEATMLGSGSSFTTGNDDTLTLGTTANWGSVSEDGTGNSVTVESSDSVHIYGTSNSATAVGSETIYDQSSGDNTINLSGQWSTGIAETGTSGDTFVVTGTYGNAQDSGSGDASVTLSGTSEGATLSGTGDTLTATGYNDNVTNNGHGNTITFNSANGGITENAGGDHITLAAANDMLYEQGTGGDTITISGNSDGASIQGSSGDTISYTGNDGFASLKSSGNSVTVTGTGDTIYDQSSGHNTISLGGSSNYGVIYAGAGDTVNASGTGEEVLDDGTGDCTISLSGASDTVFTSGTGDSVSLTGTGDYLDANSGSSITLTLGGSDNTADINSNDQTLTVSGTGNTFHIWSNGNTALITGNSNSSTINGTGNTVTESGSSDSFSTYGTGNNSFIASGSGDSISDGGSGNNSLSLTGSGDTAIVYNESNADTLSVGGTNNTITAQNNLSSGASGTATLNGTNAVMAILGTTADAITFASTAATLELFDAQGFTGTVAGLANGDAIDLANFAFSGTPTISSVTGTGAIDTATDVTVTDGSASVTLALLNQYASQFAVSTSAYTLSSDATGSTPGTLLQLASGH